VAFKKNSQKSEGGTPPGVQVARCTDLPSCDCENCLAFRGAPNRTFGHYRGEQGERRFGLTPAELAAGARGPIVSLPNAFEVWPDPFRGLMLKSRETRQRSDGQWVTTWTFDGGASYSDREPDGPPRCLRPSPFTSLVAALVVVGWAVVAARGIVAMFGG
jgi:hypothetical protein